MKEKERIRTKNENFAFKLLTEYFYLFFIFWIFFINGYYSIKIVFWENIIFNDISEFIRRGIQNFAFISIYN